MWVDLFAQSWLQNSALLGYTARVKTREGFFTDSFIPNPPDRRSRDFGQIVTSFLSTDGLPFDSVLPAERIREIFAKHNGLFGRKGSFSTVVVLWAFLGQVLRCGKEAACQSPVACIISHCKLTGKPVPTKDTGDYCVARAKLSEETLHELSNEVAKERYSSIRAHTRVLESTTCDIQVAKWCGG